MDVLSPSWFEQIMEMESPGLCFMDQGETVDTCYDEIMRAKMGEDFQQISLFPENSNSSSSTPIPRCNSTKSLFVSSSTEPQPPQNTPSIKRPKNKNRKKSDNLDRQSSNSTPVILNFGHFVPHNALGTKDEVTKLVSGERRVRPPAQTYEHILAERRRREQLSQRFIALSSILPGLKKMDKISVLGCAIKHLTHLEEKIKTLEEKSAQQTMESVVVVRKSHILIDDERSSDESNINDDDRDNAHERYNTDHLPEIEARLSDKNILIMIKCEKRKGVLVNIISQIENMNLTIMDTSSSVFGTLALNVTIITQMNEDFDMTIENLVRTLHSHMRRTFTLEISS